MIKIIENYSSKITILCLTFKTYQRKSAIILRGISINEYFVDFGSEGIIKKRKESTIEKDKLWMIL